MIEWSEQHQMIRDVIRRFIDAEIVPNVEALEHGDMPPYDILRKLYSHLRDGRDGARALRQADRAREEGRNAQAQRRRAKAASRDVGARN